MTESNLEGDVTTEWWRTGEVRLAELVASTPDDALEHPSLLPGWSRRVLVAHLARNADALVNLLEWARTGVETPMYASPEARQEGIDRTATKDPAALRADLAAAGARLDDAAAQLSDTQWRAEVRTAQGRSVPATEVTWMRAKEVWVHAVDLDGGFSFADAPPEFLAALVDDVVTTWQRRGDDVHVTLTATDLDRTWTAGDDGPDIRAPLAELAALVTGRTQDPDVALPRWL